MTCTPAPACVAVRKQATKLWPNRSQASDGICASATHTSQNPGSDHEPHVILNGVAYATAVDLTDDKTHGCDADEWAEYLRRVRDPRVKYVICNRRMFSSYPVQGIPPWTWRPYTGVNPHDKHTHLSIIPEAVFVVGPWFPQLVSIDPLTPHPDEELLLMAIAKDDLDARRAWVRRQCLDYWGHEPTVADHDFLAKEVELKGADVVLAAIADHSYAQAFRQKRGW